MDQAARGATALNAGDYASAITYYTTAISQSPNAPDYYIKRSTAYQRSQPPQYDAALSDAETGILLAIKRAKRELIAQAQFRRAVALYHLDRYGDASFVLGIVKKLDEKNKSLGVWEMKVASKLKALPEEDPKREVTIKETPDAPVATPSKSEAPKSTETSPAPKPAIQQTPADKIKHDWYQNNTHVYFTLLAKCVPKDKCAVDIQERSLNISFPMITGSDYDFSLDPLYSPIDAAASTFSVTPHKVEVTLKKQTPGVKWHKLESDTEAAALPTSSSTKVPEDVLKTSTNSHPPAYPSSSRSGPKNWDKLATDALKAEKPANAKGSDFDDLDDDEGDDVNKFFKKLYQGADPDTQRAMMKSYVESNGTALSTNWADVKKGKVETSPPDGMEAKNWGT